MDLQPPPGKLSVCCKHIEMLFLPIFLPSFRNMRNQAKAFFVTNNSSLLGSTCSHASRRRPDGAALVGGGARGWRRRCHWLV